MSAFRIPQFGLQQRGKAVGTQDFVKDERNGNVLVYVNGDLVPREDASVSVFDSGFILGDGVWEGFRLHKGVLAFADRHLDRLFEAAASIDLDIGRGRDEVQAALEKALSANNMQDGVHVRLMVTRGLKITPNQDPRHALGRATLVIVAEYKVSPPDAVNNGISLHTSSILCSPSNMFDMRLNSHSRLNLIIALLQAIKAGADEALMLDPNGFVSTCNATNLFWIKNGEVRTSTGEYCFNGITRQNIIEICRDNEIALRQGNFPLSDIHNADEAFVTGTMGGLTPVCSVDGRTLGNHKLPGTVTGKLMQLYEKLLDAECRR